MPSWKASTQSARYWAGPSTGAMTGEGEGCGSGLGTAVAVPNEQAPRKTASSSAPLRIDVLHNGGRVDVWLPFGPFRRLRRRGHRLLVDGVGQRRRQLCPYQQQRVALARLLHLLPRAVPGV